MQNEKINSNYFLYVAIFFVAVLMISNTIATKIIQLGPFSLTGAIFIFPISYIFGDILTEVYGYRSTRKVIWSGFVALILMSLCYYLVMLLPSAPFWPNQASYEAILGVVPRVVIASIIGYFAGEFSNSMVLSKMKIWTKGKYLWTRTIGSTLVGEAVDTILFVLIGFVGLIPNSSLLLVIISGYVIKVLIEVVLTPLTYLIVNKLKKIENIDVYDKSVNYNPFVKS